MDDSLFLFLALAFLGAMLFYSSNKRKKAVKALQAQVVKGAYVMLTSGIYGKITAVLENRIELETAPGQKLLVATGAVRSVEEDLKKPKPASSAAKPAAKTAAKTATKAKPRPAVKSPAKTAAKKK
jgi:preprotein translocase YajC subunit